MIGKLAELLVFGLGPLMLGVMALPDLVSAGERSIPGQVTYRERIALPPKAVMTVELADVSLADAPSTVVAKQVIRDAGQVPIRFTLTFDPVVIQPKMTYAVQARITVEDKLWFINDERYAIDPLTAANIEMVLKSAR